MQPHVLVVDDEAILVEEVAEFLTDDEFDVKTAYDGVDAEGVNLMLFATDAPVTTDELLERIADRVGGRVTVPAFERYGEQLYTGEIRSGSAPLIVDPQKGKSGRRR